MHDQTDHSDWRHAAIESALAEGDAAAAAEIAVPDDGPCIDCDGSRCKACDYPGPRPKETDRRW